MSTRSVVARPVGDGFSGRYVHWNGYPTYQGATLWQMAKVEFKGDVEALLKALIDQGGAWSALGDEQTWTAYAKKHPPMPGEKQRWVKGLGVKMADKSVELVEWHGEEDNFFMDAEWIYVLSGGESPIMSVLTGDNPPALIGSFFLEGPEPDWQVVECGPELERCQHIAEAHFPKLEGTPSARLSVQQYLGRKPLEPINAASVIVNGEEWKLSGSYTVMGDRVVVRATDASGKSKEIQITGQGAGDVTLVYPAIAEPGREIEI